MEKSLSKYAFVTEAPESNIVIVPTFLEGGFGKEVLKEYNTLVEAEYNNSNLKVLKFSDGVVKGSNSFAVPLINRIVSGVGIRVAKQADLERIIKNGKLKLRGHYEDTGLVLRSIDSPNEYLAKNLANQIKERQELIYPIMIPLTEVEVINDKDSEYGLAFRLKENANIIHAPSFEESGRFSGTDKNGLPIIDKQGSRTSYTRDSGLSQLDLGNGLDLDSVCDVLAGSGSYGRVVIVSGEAAQQKSVQKSK